MWFIVQNGVVVERAANSITDNVGGFLHSRWPGCNVYKATTPADADALADWVTAMAGDPPVLVGNTIDVDEGLVEAVKLEPDGVTEAGRLPLVLA